MSVTDVAYGSTAGIATYHIVVPSELLRMSLMAHSGSRASIPGRSALERKLDV